jgi:hypothetical protein
LKGKIAELSFAWTKSEGAFVHLKEEYASYRAKYSEEDFAGLQSRIVQLEEESDSLEVCAFPAIFCPLFSFGHSNVVVA